jgi:hypothetical protein
MTVPRTTSNHQDIVTLRDLLEEKCCKILSIIDSSKELEVSRHEAIEAKLQASEAVMEHRLKGLNELRSGVLSKAEFEAKHMTLQAELRAEAVGLRGELQQLKEWRAEQKGKASVASVYGVGLLSIISLLATIIDLVYSIVR